MGFGQGEMAVAAWCGYRGNRGAAYGDMLSFGEPVFGYYSSIKSISVMGIHVLLTEAVDHLFAKEGEDSKYLQALSRESYIWGERWARGKCCSKLKLYS
ncbi:MULTISPECIES: hypothetical protein [Brevibacillus]|uniref:hypothetical protein n=1 Tax=Brevibacillus TaxID=55080 RepID=UPI000EEF241D|nr:hypothetical protein [Brevibacillus sp.]HBZ82270.1 hypothetical protein [Brevibacillus sp.]